MILKDSPARERAAGDLGQNLVVTAGAGTGKTSLLIQRILHLLLAEDLRLERIAAITFTNKAAMELRERLEDALDRMQLLAAGTAPGSAGKGEAETVFERLRARGIPTVQVARRSAGALERLDTASITTLHAFAGEILRRHHQRAGVGAGFETDDGSGKEALFGRLWPRFIEEALGGDEAPASLRRLLGRVALEDVEDLARQLVDFKVPLEALGERALLAQEVQ
ncbi:MAG TPA: UvrD-helicase domain-containing protein, partial [Planctomycetota bacterium]|nr:UvrD-helicase domain-containing protein [Planctomycetota bacterium]